jgi:hypothetical protein
MSDNTENKKTVPVGNNLEKGRKSRLEIYNLQQEVAVMLKIMPKLTYQQIADELNKIGKVPDKDKITAQNVSDFVRTYPEVRKEVMLSERKYLKQLVLEGIEFDMLSQLKGLLANTTYILEKMQDEAFETGNIPDPSKYSTVAKELRETMKQIENIHKEIYDMEVVKSFLIEVINTLKEVSPEALNVFIKKMKGKRDTNSIVNEILKGGM